MDMLSPLKNMLIFDKLASCNQGICWGLKWKKIFIFYFSQVFSAGLRVWLFLKYVQDTGTSKGIQEKIYKNKPIPISKTISNKLLKFELKNGRVPAMELTI